MSYWTKTQLTDQYGFSVECTPMDELRVVTPVRLAGATFSGSTLDTNFWTVTTGSVSGSAIQESSQIILTTGSAINGSVILQSTRVGRYVGGSANRYRAQIRLGDTGNPANSRKWGLFTATDGAYFKFSGSSIYACTLKNGTETPVISNLWNTSTTLPVLTNVNSYEIYYTNAKVYFVIAGVLMHTASFPASTWSANLNLGVRMENTNSGSAAAQNILEARVATVYRLGQEQTAPIYKHLTGATTMVLKYAPGTLHKIIVNTAGTLCTIYDGASAAGNVIGILDTNKTSGTIGSIAYDVPFFTGLTFVTTGATTDLTIVYE